LDLTVLLIVMVFGGILSVSLYFYLFRSEARGRKMCGDNENDEVNELAKALVFGLQKIDLLEMKVQSIEDYLEEKVRIRKKKLGKQNVETRQ